MKEKIFVGRGSFAFSSHEITQLHAEVYRHVSSDRVLWEMLSQESAKQRALRAWLDASRCGFI